jgi:hypothetical protein
VMGQAAGTAGAMAAYACTSPRAVDLRELRALLTSQGAIL